MVYTLKTQLYDCASGTWNHVLLINVPKFNTGAASVKEIVEKVENWKD